MVGAEPALRRRVAALLAVACMLGGGAAAAQEGAASAATAAPQQAEARQTEAWLTRIHQAASRRNFQGTFVVSAGGMVSSTRIVHYCQGDEQVERIDALDGQARHVLRHNDTVHTLWPSARVASVERYEGLASFPALLQAPGDGRYAEHYRVQPLGDDRVAGHKATVLLVRPRDALRFGYRLWVEQDSSLLLRAEVLARDGEILESAAFSDLSLDVKPQPEVLLKPLRRLDGWRLLRPVVTRTGLEAEGWSMRVALPGFREIGCVKRHIEPDSEAAPAQVVLQSVWSDGLAYVSVFIEPFQADRHPRPMQTAIGATHTLMQRRGDWWVTVMGEVPAPTVHHFAKALQRLR